MKDDYVKSKTGFKWALTSNIIKAGLGFLVILFLTYVLSPERIGMISIIMVIYGISETLVQFGISQSIIAREKNTDDELSSIFWTNLGIGVFACLLINALSPVIASFYGQPELVFLVRFLSIAFLIEPLDLVFRAILQKNLQFVLLEKVNMLKQVVLSGATVAFVLMNLDVLGYIYALVASIAVSALALAIIFYKKRIWFPRFHFRVRDIKKHYKFGFFVTARTMLNYIGFHIDELIIGKLLGLELLGVYYFAKKITDKPTRLVIDSFNKILFPLYSKIKTSPEQFKKTYLNMTSFFASWSFFIMISAILVTPFIIPLMFNEKWNGSIILIQIFFLISVLKTLSNGFAPPALYAFKKPNIVLRIEIIIVLLRVVFLFIGAFFSINVVGMVLLTTVLVKVLLLQLEVNKIMKSPLKEYLQKLRTPFENALLGIAVGFVIQKGTTHVLGAVTPYASILFGFSFALTYLLLFIKRDKQNYGFVMNEVSLLMRGLKNAKKAGK